MINIPMDQLLFYISIALSVCCVVLLILVIISLCKLKTLKRRVDSLTRGKDTESLEDIILSLTSGNNLYMIGDVKQSIYKFRLAEPEIFQKKYRDYANGVILDSIKIDLNKNFRSKEKVINFIIINHVYNFLYSRFISHFS